jgi:hypothetical protein
MEVIKLQNQLKQLDREWVMERESYIYRTKDGGMRLPGADDLFIPVIIIIGGAFLFIAAIYERTLIALLESIFIPPLGISLISSHQKLVGRYQAAEFRDHTHPITSAEPNGAILSLREEIRNSLSFHQLTRLIEMIHHDGLGIDSKGVIESC